MYVTNITDDYDICNCKDNENDIDIIIPALLFTIPCGLSVLCLISLMVYTLIKPLFNNKCIRRNIYTQRILYGV